MTNVELFEKLRKLLEEAPPTRDEEEKKFQVVSMLGLALLEQTLGDVRRAADALEKIADASARAKW